VRDKLWLTLRKSSLLRYLYNVRVLSRSLRNASFLLVPSSRRIRMKVQSGPGKDLVLEVNPRWEHAFLEGEYEVEVHEAIERLCRPGVTFFDVGANFGYYSMLAARLGANSIAFEPDDSNAETLLMHARLNGLVDRIRLERAAVFSHTGRLLLSPAGGERPHGNAHVRSSESSAAGAVSVRCTTLDDFAALNPPPEVVKVDVEGAESEVMKGAIRVFESLRPFLICEVHDDMNEKFICPWLRERCYLMNWSEPADVFPRQLFAWPAEQAIATFTTESTSDDR
jgi:FkbM family methyltransferase